MSIQKDIKELIEAGIITSNTAKKIEEYYAKKSSSPTNRLFVVFGILGAILVGLGIILMIAHNWDELSKTTKTVLAFLPLILSQFLCVYILLKKSVSKAWVESATTLLFFSIGACISLISQIYHIPGNLSSLLLVWMVLFLPLIYVMKSSVAPLLYIVGITYYAAEASYFSYPNFVPYAYWGLLLAVLPQYFILAQKSPKSNYLTLENILISLSVTIALGTFPSVGSYFIYVAYFSLFGLFYNIGANNLFGSNETRSNPYKVIGALGTLTLLFVSSFEWFWLEVIQSKNELENWITYVSFWVALGITVLAIFYLLKLLKTKSIRELPIFAPLFLVFIILFGLGQFSSSVWILINVVILAVSILTIIEGAKKEHLGILNFGLAIITLWIIIRFLNTDLSFIIRGLLLITIGVGFFTANYLMLKKRKTNG